MDFRLFGTRMVRRKVREIIRMERKMDIGLSGTGTDRRSMNLI